MQGWLHTGCYKTNNNVPMCIVFIILCKAVTTVGRGPIVSGTTRLIIRLINARTLNMGGHKKILEDALGLYLYLYLYLYLLKLCLAMQICCDWVARVVIAIAIEWLISEADVKASNLLVKAKAYRSKYNNKNWMQGLSCYHPGQVQDFRLKIIMWQKFHIPLKCL